MGWGRSKLRRYEKTHQKAGGSLRSHAAVRYGLNKRLIKMKRKDKGRPGGETRKLHLRDGLC